MQNKRGLSEVIVTVLIILISIAAIFLVWQFLKPTLKEEAGSINLDKVKVDLEISRNSLVKSSVNDSFKINVIRNAGEGDLSKIKIRVENETNAAVYEFNGIPELGESQLSVPNTIANYAKVVVIPIVRVGDNEGEAGINDILVVRDVATQEEVVLKSCSELGGVICSGSTPICSGSIISSSDGNCCTGGTCQAACVNLCPSLGLVNNTCFNSTRVQNRTCQMFGSCLNWTMPVYSNCPAGKICSNGNCTTVVCSSNSQCGSNFYSAKFCLSGNVYRNYTAFTCNNPGTVSSSCSNTITPVLNQTCSSGCNVTTGNCIVPVVSNPECSNYTSINWDLYTIDQNSRTDCSSDLVDGWYRLNGTYKKLMEQRSYIDNVCNTHAPGFLTFVHPTTLGETTSGSICYHWSGSVCAWSTSAQATMCDGYYVYYLSPPYACNLHPCSTN